MGSAGLLLTFFLNNVIMVQVLYSLFNNMIWWGSLACVHLKKKKVLWQVSESLSKIIVKLQASTQELKQVWGERTWEKPKLLKRLLNCQHKGKGKLFEWPGFFSVEGTKKKNPITFLHIHTSHLQPEGPTKHRPTGSSSAQPPPKAATFLRTGWANKHLSQVFTAELVKSSQTSHPSLEEFAGSFNSGPAAAPQAGAGLTAL